MSFTGVGSLNRSIDKCNAWLAGIEEGFGTHDRRLAYRVARAWLHSLRDRLTVEVSAHFAGPRELLELAAAEPVTGGKR